MSDIVGLFNWLDIDSDDSSVSSKKIAIYIQIFNSLSGLWSVWKAANIYFLEIRAVDSGNLCDTKMSQTIEFMIVMAAKIFFCSSTNQFID